jgi:hypothetical protein
MARKMLYYIKERHNPQLGIYYVAKGQMTKKEARSIGSCSVYGYNIMLAFETEKEYLAALAGLRKDGQRVQESCERKMK